MIVGLVDFDRDVFDNDKDASGAQAQEEKEDGSRLHIQMIRTGWPWSSGFEAERPRHRYRPIESNAIVIRHYDDASFDVRLDHELMLSNGNGITRPIMFFRFMKNGDIQYYGYHTNPNPMNNDDFEKNLRRLPSDFLNKDLRSWGNNVPRWRVVDDYIRLTHAAEEGDMATCKSLLRDDAAFNLSLIRGRDIAGWTALMCAASNDHVDIIEFLLSKGAMASLHARDNYGLSCLMIASAHGSVRAVEYLISQGTNVNDKDDDGAHDDVISVDINGSHKKGESSLLLSAKNGHFDTVKFLVSAGANINYKNNNGCSALMTACENKHLDIAEFLMSKGANIHDKCDRGYTCLMYACIQRPTMFFRTAHSEELSKNAIAITKILMCNGANIHDVTNDGHTCTNFATFAGNSQNIYQLRKWPWTMAIIALKEDLAIYHFLDAWTIIDLWQYLGDQ